MVTINKTEKMKTKLYISILSVLLLFMACIKDEEITIDPPILESVSGLQYELFSNNDSVKITWLSPNTDTDIKTIIRHSNGITVLDKGIESFKYGIIETNKEYHYTVKIKSAAENVYSLGQTVRFIREGAFNVSDIALRQEEDSVLISWQLPVEGNISDILISWTSSEESGSHSLSGTNSNYKLIGLPLGAYTFTIKTTNASGLESHVIYRSFRVGPTKVGFLSQYANSDAIIDDDEKAAAQWFFANYANSAFISFEDIKSGTIDLNEFRVIWWQSDEVGGKNLAAIAKESTVVNAIADFHKQGGNLFLTMHATMYLHTIGRLPVQPSFSEVVNIGDGEGGENPDVWGVNAGIKSFDNSSHPIFKGLIINNADGNRKLIPLIDDGWKEDHNSNWGGLPAISGYANDDDAFVPFLESTFGVINLGSWDGVRDYWQAGLIEAKPFGEFSGTTIAIGLGSYEWHQNTGTNAYHPQIEKLTENCIEYLKTK